MTVSILLLCALVFVNGWTDAPNAIATCVGCGAMKMRTASLMAAVMNLLGLTTAYLTSGKIAEGMINIVTLHGGIERTAINVAALGVVIWSTIAWYYGLPTSESHAIVASLCGSAVATSGSVDKFELTKLALGLMLSLGLGFGLGWFFGSIGTRIHIKEKRLKNAVITSSALMAFSHGAQDGQKFVGMLMLCFGRVGGAKYKFFAVILVSALIFLGTSLGGKRIVDKVGGELTTLNEKTAFCADLGGAICVLLSTYQGIPISTTHSKTSAVMGVAVSANSLKRSLGTEMLLAWVLTFPCLFAFGYFVTSFLK